MSDLARTDLKNYARFLSKCDERLIKIEIFTSAGLLCEHRDMRGTLVARALYRPEGEHEFKIQVGAGL